ncbi:hypothetical protein HXX76_007942 [Chlamydomonas incerta]|uniref:Uncharacterized protein n=1 Tax=Chlamydomonas incerta TaxID=51695 RepID=A0A835W338_CHLIN|nr:hypothetical protein HXX76_007942 [Chlamydomonas incerta]|eukprot:KAG2434216.1 hypothetical protein HXX76_007942 [Chlamydomonas incerta]
MLTACSAAAGWPSDLASFLLCASNQPLQGVRDDASGLAADPAGGWWLVSNHPLAALRYSPDMSRLQQVVALPGIQDPEAITCLAPGRLAVSEEMRDVVLLSTPPPVEPGAAAGQAAIVGAEKYDLPLGVPRQQAQYTGALRVPVPRQPNKGFEGLAWSAAAQSYYLAQEDTPQLVYELKPNGTFRVLFDAAGLGLRDLSELACYRPDCSQLLIMSQASKRVVLVDLAGRQLSGLKVKGLPRPEVGGGVQGSAAAGGGVQGHGQQGLAVSPDGLTMAIASEPNTFNLYKTAPPTAPSPAAPPAQPADAPRTDSDLPAAAPEDVAASMKQAELAMHALLNQLSDPRPGQPPADGSVASLLQAMAAQVGAGDTAAPPRGLGMGAEIPTRAAPGQAAARPGPGSAAAAPAAAGARGRGHGMAMLEAVLGGVGAVLLGVTGPRLSGAVARTRLARCLLALLAAAALHAGLLEPAALRVPPLVVLLLTEVALVAGAWVQVRGAGGSGLSRSGSLSRVGSSSMSLDRMAADADPDSGAAAAGGAASAAPAGGAAPPPGFDWLTLVPGLRPLLDGLYSLQALLGGLVGDGAVFVAATVALAACSELARPLTPSGSGAAGHVEL